MYWLKERPFRKVLPDCPPSPQDWGRTPFSVFLATWHPFHVEPNHIVLNRLLFLLTHCTQPPPPSKAEATAFSFFAVSPEPRTGPAWHRSSVMTVAKKGVLVGGLESNKC